MRLGIIGTQSRGPILVAILCNLGTEHRMIEDIISGALAILPTNVILEI